ncbi:uncharacterized protein CCOS01_00296 [Colletotrichum costaricense]|uniref:Uncharacterized protein n=1 Tax=Colletotrichum costaricense TaxID=1209916 RepID=A0AAJ0E5X6_9PEZI|nr:uncharacterized protein CCOS01_00296 [Colletotrichum costaricense]KAK1538982.1 hypothetical protein CCOS01_00296 [Colletotrichum costaricense]
MSLQHCTAASRAAPANASEADTRCRCRCIAASMAFVSPSSAEAGLSSGSLPVSKGRRGDTYQNTQEQHGDFQWQRHWHRAKPMIILLEASLEQVHDWHIPSIPGLACAYLAAYCIPDLSSLPSSCGLVTRRRLTGQIRAAVPID